MTEKAIALHGQRVNDETRQVQGRLLEILKVIDRVCLEHGLTYYLLCGTMLGAVRHKGFIPWDDDADVGMPREDYDRLLKHADEWMPKGYELVSGGCTEGYPYPFARIQESDSTYRMHRSYDFVGGLPIDLFPLDGMVDDCFARRFHYVRYKMWWKILYFTHTDPYKHGRGLRSIITLLLRKLFKPVYVHRKLDEVRKQWSINDTAMMADHDYRPEKGVVPKTWYGKPTPIEFEGYMLMGVAKPHEYLSHLYGNYMEIPSEIPPQNYRFLDLNKPWMEYVAEQKSKTDEM